MNDLQAKIMAVAVFLGLIVLLAALAAWSCKNDPDCGPDDMELM